MRRRGGADALDLDTREQIARIYYIEPVELDFELIADAALSAAFTTAGIETELSGAVVSSRCERCGEEHLFLRVAETGQMLELEGEGVAPGYVGRVRADVTGWDGPAAVLRAEPVAAAVSEGASRAP